MDSEVYFNGPEGPDKEDKAFMVFLSIMLTLIGMITVLMAVVIIVAMWDAGLMNFLFWSVVTIFVGFISKLVYRKLMESDIF